MNKQETIEFINSHDSKKFDVETALFDLENKNYTGDMQDYSHSEIILQSVMNGQFKQARQQAINYNYDNCEIEQLINQFKGE